MDCYVENYIENLILEECLDELDKQEHQIVVLYYWWGIVMLRLEKFWMNHNR